MKNILKSDLETSENIRLFSGPNKIGNTKTMFLWLRDHLRFRSFFSALIQKLHQLDTKIYLVTPSNLLVDCSIKNTNQILLNHVGRVRVYQSIKDLPGDLAGVYLMIDDGLGYLSYVHSGTHIKTPPRYILATLDYTPIHDL